jgi:hypothetical protein
MSTGADFGYPNLTWAPHDDDFYGVAWQPHVLVVVARWADPIMKLFWAHDEASLMPVLDQREGDLNVRTCLSLHRADAGIHEEQPVVLQVRVSACLAYSTYTINHTISYHSLVPLGKLILYSVSYRSTKYCMIPPDSKRLIVLPSVKVSVKAGMRPLGLMARNQGSFWVSLLMSILWTL